MKERKKEMKEGPYVEAVVVSYSLVFLCASTVNISLSLGFTPALAFCKQEMKSILELGPYSKEILLYRQQ